jgi:hypothetical protein
MDQAVSKSNDLGAGGNVFEHVGTSIPQSRAGLADDLEFSLHGGAGARILPIGSQIESSREFLDICRRTENVVE